MPRSRNPVRKQLVSGSHPERLKGRSAPSKTRPIGEPYARMSEGERELWREFSDNLPWLHSSHRILLRLACHLGAQLEDGEMGINRTQALSAILSKLGATPTDESRVNHSSDPETDPNDRFFTRTH